MNPQGADLLSQLRDIHGAPEVSWWPPAPGWWIVAFLLLFMLALLLRKGWKAWRRSVKRRRILRWVDDVERQIDPESAPQDFLAAINRIFKVVALAAFPDQHCARLQGRDWSAFLQRELGDDPDSSQLEALAFGPYQPVPLFNAGALTRLARGWILRHG